MRLHFSALFVFLLLSPTALAADGEADEMKAAMDAFAEAFAGTWVNESKVDSDMPGIAKKGDTLVAHVTFTPKDGLILVDWKAEVNGKPAGASAKGLVGWDASQKKLKMRWFTTAGASGTGAYWQKNGHWIAQGQYIQADGTKGSSRATHKFEGKDKYIVKVTKRKQGEETLPDGETTWTREPK